MIFTKEQIGISKDDLEAHLRKTTHKVQMEQLNGTIDAKKDIVSSNESVYLKISFFIELFQFIVKYRN